MHKKYILIVLLWTMLHITPSYAEIGFTEHLIEANYNTPWYVYTADIDDDDDIDIISGARFGSTVDWWENNGSENFTRHVISYSAYGAMRVSAADFNGDGNMDVVCAIDMLNKISWYENDGLQQFTEHIIAPWLGVTYVYTIDLDQDDDVDILAAACEQASNKMGWFENDGNGNFTEHVVIDDYDHANCVHAADMDGDDDIDLIASASWASDVSWFENDLSKAPGESATRRRPHFQPWPCLRGTSSLFHKCSGPRPGGVLPNGDAARSSLEVHWMHRNSVAGITYDSLPVFLSPPPCPPSPPWFQI